MKMKYFVLSILLLCTFVRANVLDDFVDSRYEQTKATAWVKDSTRGSISDDEADKIVKEAYANAYSKKINPLLVLAVIRNESNFKVKAKSVDGSRGLMQVIPRWHKDKLAGRDPLSLTTSIDVGTWILHDCLVKHKGNILTSLSCYSGGGGKVYYNKVMKHQYALMQSIKQKDILIAAR